MTRNKKILSSLIIAVSILAVGFSIYYLVFYNYEPTGPIGGVGVQGEVIDVSMSAKVITVLNSADNTEIYLALTDDTKLFDVNYRPVNLHHIKQGLIIEAIGERTKDDSLIPSEIYVIENPCAVCVNGCDTCPEGCDECLIGIEKKLKDPNMKWYYNPEGP